MNARIFGFLMLTNRGPSDHLSGAPAAGKPLARWILEAALATKGIERVFVATDDDELFKKIVPVPSARVERRPGQSAEEFARSETCGAVLVLNAAAPLIRSADFAAAVERFQPGVHAMVAGGCRQNRRLWTANSAALLLSGAEAAQTECAGFHLIDRSALAAGMDYLSGEMTGTVSLVDVPEPAMTVATRTNWLAVEALLREHRIYPEISARGIRLVASDVDGVLTDAGMYYTESGDEEKKFNTRDGMGFKLLRDAGFATAIVTTENTKIVARRAAKLKIPHVAQGTWDKVGAVETMCRELNIDFSQVAYIGDDINCRPLLQKAGFAACPSDAIASVKDVVHYVCSSPGGGGAFRELAELVLAAQSAPV